MQYNFTLYKNYLLHDTKLMEIFMKTNLNLLILLSMTTFSSPSLSAQGAMDKGRTETYDLENFKLHVYYTNDALNDASYIVEGKEGLVTMEHPLFKENAAEFDDYVKSLGKPVEKIITDYHVGSTGAHDVVMAEGMPGFTKGAVYGGMMENFAQIFGDAIVPLPTGKAEEVNFGTTRTWAGVSFEFRRGASTDFPGASIVIGGKAYYTHWTPAKMHMSHLQLSSPEAVDAEIAEAGNALRSGCRLFIGGHGGTAQTDAVAFKIEYLKSIKELLTEHQTAGEFAEELKKRYPGLPGEERVADLAKALCANR